MQAGLPANDDFNGAEQDGVGSYQVTQRGGMRCSAAVAYLHPVLGRENLTLITGAHVNRVLMDGNRATGLEIDRDGEVAALSAEREVILSAGTYQSPQILMLSGIGPAEDLALVNIPCALDLPVGQGLQDHPSTWITYTTDEPSLLSAESPENLALLTTEGRGPLTSNFAESGGFLRTDDALEAPDVQLAPHPRSSSRRRGRRRSSSTVGRSRPACCAPRAPASSSCAPACPRPSRGSCTTTWSPRRTGLR